MSLSLLPSSLFEHLSMCQTFYSSTRQETGGLAPQACKVHLDMAMSMAPVPFSVVGHQKPGLGNWR